MKFKKILISLLSFALIASFLIVPMTANAQRIYIKLSFAYGYDIGYYNDSEAPDTLFIEGTGRMFDLNDVHYLTDSTDYFVHNSEVYQETLCNEQESTTQRFFNQKNVVIGEGITYIGDFTFCFNNRLEKIYIPDSVTEISDHMIFINGATHNNCKCMMRYNNDPSKITICCSKDSYAYKYAVDNGFKVDTESQAPQPTPTTTVPTNPDTDPTTTVPTTTATKYNIEIEDDLSVGKVEYTYRDDGVLLLSINFNPGVNMQHMIIVDWQIEGDNTPIGGSECQTEYWVRANSDLKIKPIYHNVSTLAGDTNSDSKLTAADVLLTRKHIAGQNTELNIGNADVNGDNKITAADVLLVRRKISGQSIAPWDIAK